jgi:hypothetical protein
MSQSTRSAASPANWEGSPCREAPFLRASRPSTTAAAKTIEVQGSGELMFVCTIVTLPVQLPVS